MLNIRRYALLALLVLGSATLLFSCADKTSALEYDYETLMTERSENRTIMMMENGKRSYSFTAPIIEGYSLAQNPYQEFRKGIKMITYTSDSLSLEDATITANYAIYYDKQKLWEAKGNVVIIKKNRKSGDTVVTGLTEVYTQQLFWDARTKKIYSNVDTKVLQPDGWHFGVGFEADEDLKNIHFRKYKSEMEFDFSPVDENAEDADKKGPDSDAKRPGQHPRPGGRPTPRDAGGLRSGGTVNPSMTTTPSPAGRQQTTPRPATTTPKSQRNPLDAQSSMSTSMDLDGSRVSGGNPGRGSAALQPPKPTGSAERPAPKSGSQPPKSDARTSTKR